MLNTKTLDCGSVGIQAGWGRGVSPSQRIREGGLAEEAAGRVVTERKGAVIRMYSEKINELMGGKKRHWALFRSAICHDYFASA